MQPNNQNSVPTDNPYAFIVNQAPKLPKHKLLGNQASFKQRILVILGGGLIVIVVIMILSSLFSSKPTTTGLLTLAQDQQTMVNLSSPGKTPLVQQVTKNLSANISLSLSSSQLSLIKYFSSIGTTITVTTLTTPLSIQESSQLTNSPANNIDNLYIQLMTKNLNNYVTATKQAYSTASGNTEKSLLSQFYVSGSLLLKQLNTTSNAL